jgi:hypothetical protein
VEKVTIIGIVAKNVFQLHGATSDETAMFRKKLLRPLSTGPCRSIRAVSSRWRLLAGRITGREMHRLGHNGAIFL